MIFVAFLISTSFAASKGPGICEGLGLCELPQNGAYPRTDVDVKRFQASDNLRWIVDGCEDRGTDVLEAYLENIDNATSWQAAGYYTVCCSDDDDACWTPVNPNSRPSGVANRDETSYCGNQKSFQDAKRYCESYGRRLCTKPELQSGICCADGLGCSPRNRRYWTEDAYIPFYGCPKGMDKVTPPIRHEGYRVYADAERYTPGEALTITVEVLDKTKKYLGLMIYAVVNDADSYGPAGCPLHESGVPTRGCDGYVETRVGTWDLNESPDWKLGSCPEVLTHSHAALKKYNETFTWIAPDAGFGSVIFRVLIKHGSTNGGMFYWPMLEDLLIEEGPAPSNETAAWHSGSISQSCNTICGNLGKTCSMNQESFTTLDGYDMMKRSPEATCQMPLLSSCQQQSPTKDSETGHCWLSNPASTQCDEPMSYVACCGGGSTECGDSMTLADAREYCSSRGKEICTRAELRDCSISCTTGDRQYWTSDEVTECVSPLEKICENCDCTTGFDPLGYIYDTPLECAHAVLEVGRENGEYYAGIMVREGVSRACWICTEEKIFAGKGTTGLYQLYALGAPLATPAEEVCQGCKCGGETDDDVRNVQSIIDCQQEATKKGYDYFSYRADNGLCHPANALTCSTEESRSNNANFNSYFVANFSCSTQVWISRNCGEEQLIDLPPSVSRGNGGGSIETTQAQTVDICESTLSDGGDERLCQCELIPTTDSPTKTPTTQRPTQSGETFSPTTDSPTKTPSTIRTTTRPGETFSPTARFPTHSPSLAPTRIEGNAGESNADDDNDNATTIGVAVGVTCAVLLCCCLGFIYFFFFMREENIMKEQIGESDSKQESHDFNHSLQIQKLPPSQSLEGVPAPPPGRPTPGPSTRNVGGRRLPNRPPPPRPKQIENRF